MTSPQKVTGEGPCFLAEVTSPQSLKFALSKKIKWSIIIRKFSYWNEINFEETSFRMENSSKIIGLKGTLCIWFSSIEYCKLLGGGVERSQRWRQGGWKVKGNVGWQGEGGGPKIGIWGWLHLWMVPKLDYLWLWINCSWLARWCFKCLVEP